VSEAFAIPPPEDAVDQKTLERLRQAVDTVISWDVIPQPPVHSHFPRRIERARQALRRLELSLARQSIGPVPVDPELATRRSALLELGANYRAFRSAITAVSDKPRSVARLPRLETGPRHDEPRIAGVAREYLRAVDGTFSAATFGAFVSLLQSHERLNVDELWRFGGFLKFVLLELLLDESLSMLRGRGSVSVPSLMTHILSLRAITHADWVYVIEPLITFDELLMKDPSGVYGKMDFDSRELYRRQVAEFARRSNCSEWQVAQIALELAQKAAESPMADARLQRKRAHVGFYFLDKGLPQLSERIGFHPSPFRQMREFVRTNGEDFFLSGIWLLTFSCLAAALFPILLRIETFTELVVLLVLLFTPATQVAVELVNNAITSFFDPEPLPKLDFSEGIPRECTTLVAVPTLLLNEKQVHKLINDLEVRFLGNRDPNLHFVLLTDLADSVSKPRDRDSHPMVELGVRLIGELNAKYPFRENGAFILLHRHRVFNSRQGVWMGWERKRGKLLDLNKLLVNEFDAFPIKAGPLEVLKEVRYVLTLDTDSQLPSGTAAKLTGAIAHPLNQAVIDHKQRIVTEGFGILQPRIGVAVRSTASSRLAAIYSGQGGFDLYSRAISDAYQDLFGEGIFTGKGIYEVAALHAVLDRRFPRDSLLSHDLIEGAYARAGLVTDVELVDDYPSHYNAYIRRRHRWVRGDWQIAQWMLFRVPDETGRLVANPISSVSRWKIFDNLRRSLLDPALFFLFIAGWTFLPGGPIYWTIVLLLMLFFPAMAQFVFSLGRAIVTGVKSQTGEAISGLGQASMVALLRLAFLPHNTLLAFDAILRSLIRRFITGERLLEWETAAQSEAETGRHTAFERYVAAAPIVALSVGAIIRFFAPDRGAFVCALPILALWVLTDPITIWLNRSPRVQRPVTNGDREFLSAQALRIWRYFYQFSNEQHNYLIPDNVKEEGLAEAARVSPTNIGLLLNAQQAACEFGFVTTPEFATLTGRTLETIERMEKYRGHLYNWYNTETLESLDPAPFVSSVDSGNLAASLFTLHSGTRALANKQLLRRELFEGLRVHMRILLAEKPLARAFSRAPMPDSAADRAAWIAWLPSAQTDLETISHSKTLGPDCDWWVRETLNRLNSIAHLLEGYLPWLMPQFSWLRVVHQLGLNDLSFDLNCVEALQFAEELQFRIATAHRALAADAAIADASERLLDLLPAAIHNLRSLCTDLHKLARQAERLAMEMDFSFLVDPYRRILSIGFSPATNHLHESCYDLLASEARIATFLAIARGDVPRQSWLKLGRDHTFAYGRFLLLSWSGTMFEYMMPALWMRAYPATLIARTQDACVQVQQAFGRDRGIPWGISESGASQRNDRGDYHYFAYGIPRLALWFESNAGPVVSPYSTFLALAVDPPKALRNLRRMESSHWTGAYGFYEAADYSASRRRPALVKEWMAHHMGMSLLATTNLLHDNVVQQWFHEHAMIQAAEMLLQEAPVSKAVLRAQLKEITPIKSKVKAQPVKMPVIVKAAL
jgi:cyclic beta-1,2-glucan synthetase